MKWLAIFAVLILAQQPTEAPHGKGTAKANSAEVANQTANSKESPAAPSTSIVKSTNDENPKIQRTLVWFTGLLVIVGFLQAGVMLLQWTIYRRQAGEMRRQRHEMRRQRHVMLRQWRAMRSQLGQMESAGKQTDRMIEQASKQVSVAEKAGIHTEALAEQAVRQTELTRQELELAHRPWIAVDIAPNSPLMFDERGCVMMFNVTMTNVGHSVAKHVSLWAEFALTGVDNPIEVRDKLCNIMKRPENENSDYGWLLFPGQRAVEQRAVIGRPEDVRKAIDTKLFQGLNAIGLHLVGCVDYPSAFDLGKHHQTKFVYLVGYVDSTRGAVKGAFDPAVKTYHNIVLTPTLHGASAD